MKIRQWMALVLSAILAFAMPLGALAEEGAVESAAPEPGAIQLAVVDISSETATQSELAQEEIANYSEIANEIENSEEGSVTVEGDDGLSTVYSIDEQRTNEDQTVLQAVTSQDGSANVAISTYEEIVLTSNEGETAAPDAGATAAPEASETTAPEASETAAPEASETAAPEASATAAPEASETAAPEASETTAPEASETAAPEASETAAPEASATAAPEASATAAPEAGEPTEDENAQGTAGDSQIPDGILDVIGGPIEEEFENEYHAGSAEEELASITMSELLGELEKGPESEDYEFYKDFALSLGLGKDVDDTITVLTEIVEEYNANQAAYDQYLADLAAYNEAVQSDPDAVPPTPVEKPEEPRYTLNSVDITLDKDVTEETLTDGTNGYRTQISIDANATYTVYYDGEVEVEVDVPYEGGTDFVITLDVSGSMWGGPDCAMLEAARTVLGEILQNPENTFSIVFYGTSAVPLTLDLNGDGICESVFKVSDGITLDDIFNAGMDGYGASLQEAIDSGEPGYMIADHYNIYSDTGTSEGLNAAYALLSELYGGQNPDDRNSGVILFTDGDANVPRDNPQELTVVSERQLVEDFGATVVNVALGSTTIYEPYLNPESENYIYNEDNSNGVISTDYTPPRELLMKENVVYYNIPETTDEQLADDLSELFKTAFKTIVTEQQQLQTSVVEEGILAAVGSQLIEAVPSYLEIVQRPGDTYHLIGRDEDGNTLIAWDLGNLESGDHKTLSYFAVPVDENTTLDCAVATGADTVLVTNPVHKVLNEEEDTRIAVIYHQDSNRSKATMPKTGVAMVPVSVLWFGLFASLALIVAIRRRVR